LTWAPHVVLLPHLVKNDMGGDARSLGLIFAAGGLSAIVTSLTISQVRLPRRHLTFIYAMFGFAVLDLAVYALTQEPWQAMVVAFVAECGFMSGVISETVGVRAVTAACGITATALTLAIFLLPGMREVERTVSLS
jgi:predicted MFS family arabinose efflux permease